MNPLQLTWIELLPLDVRNKIRMFVAKNDFTYNVLSELFINTKNRREYIDDCERIEEYTFIGTKSSRSHVYWGAYSNYLASVQHYFGLNTINEISIVNVLYNIQQLLTYDDTAHFNSIDISIDMILFYVRHNQEWLSYRLDIFKLLFSHIENMINTYHYHVDVVKTTYKNTVAISDIDDLHNHQYYWRDNAKCFKKYLYENVMINNLKTYLVQLFDMFIYNCGHLVNVYKKICQYRHELYEIKYD